MGTTILRKAVRHRDAVFVLIVCALGVALWWMPTGFEEAQPREQDTVYTRGKVLEADNTDVGLFGVIRQGDQRLTIEVLNGPFAGETVECDNLLIGDLEIDCFYVPGMTVLLALNLQDGAIHWTSVRGPHRLRWEAALLAMFGVLLLLTMGWAGAKAMLSFVFAALMIWKVLIPCFLKQYDPIPVAIGVVAVLTGTITFLIGGLTKRGLVAFLGAFLGLLLTAGLALAFSGPLSVNGAVRPFAKMVVTRLPEFDLLRMFIAGVFIASSGAVMDLAMDISTAMDELRKHHPRIGRFELMRSGLQVGRAVIGTMTTTLLLAYSGGFMTFLMWFMVQGIPLNVMFNTHYLSAEILHTLMGSFGLVAVAPFTAFVGSFIYVREAHGPALASS